MDINTWLTIITVLIAVLAFFPKEERKLLEFKLNKIEYWSVLITLVVVIPYLILFPKLLIRVSFLKTFTITNGFDPPNIAFGIFYLVFIWIVIRLFWLRPKNKISEKAITYYNKLLSEQPFNQFFTLFIKYTPDKIPKNHWKLYENIFFHPDFLKGIVQNQPGYLYKFWSYYNTESDFRNIFTLFISDTQSAYYKEIKSNGESQKVLANSPFLQTVLLKHLKQSIDNEILPIMYDAIQSLLKLEKNKQNNVYLQRHDFKFIKEEQGYDLPVYYHIKFIGLLYSNAIWNKIDIAELSNFNGHMRTLFSEMISTMLNNLPIIDDDSSRENETNYHWLVGKTFEIISDWLEIFGGEHLLSPAEYESGIPKFGHILFDKKSSYTYFIPQCFTFCLKSLYEGLENKKINQSFINTRVHYDILSYYYSHYAKDEIRTQIENEIIKDMPKEILHHVLDFSFDEEFAVHYYSFKNKEFRGSKKEIELQNRLWNFLNKNNLLE